MLRRLALGEPEALDLPEAVGRVKALRRPESLALAEAALEDAAGGREPEAHAVALPRCDVAK